MNNKTFSTTHIILKIFKKTSLFHSFTPTTKTEKFKGKLGFLLLWETEKKNFW